MLPIRRNDQVCYADVYRSVYEFMSGGDHGLIQSTYDASLESRIHRILRRDITVGTASD
jgi:cyanophycinase-like exopeptidase